MRQPRKSPRAALCALGLCVLSLSPATLIAQPPVLRGIDVATVLTMRDHVRATAAEERVNQGARVATLNTLETIVIDPGHGGENQGAIGTAHVHEKFLTLDLAFALRDQLQEAYPTARVILTRYWDRSMGLSERIALANEEGADLFLSLHYNAAVHDRAVGVETYFLTTEQAIPDAEPPTGELIASKHPSTVTGLHQGASHDGHDHGEALSAEESAAESPGLYNDAMITLQRDLARATQHERSGLLAETIQANLVAHTESLDRGVKQANFGVLRGALMPAVVVEAGFVTHPEEGEAVLETAHRQGVVDALMTSIVEFDEAIAKQNAR